jgi:hypothetical protein
MSVRLTITLTLSLLLIAACNSSEAPPVPSGVSAVSGSNQFATVGTAAANPLVVLVLDSNGNPSASTPVQWRVLSGGGTVADTVSTSDQNGHASMTYTAGANPGIATVVATVGQIWTATFTIYLQAASPRVVAVGTGSGQ